MEKKVSIIVPVFNAQENLRRCLDSLVGQTIKDIEIIIINAGSEDESEYIIKEYMEKYPEMFVYLSEEKIGRANARNKGIDKVKGNFLMFVDSDDYLEGEACETLYKEAMKSNYDIVTCNSYYYHLATDYKEEMCLEENFENLTDEKRYVISNYKPWGKLFNTCFWRTNNLKFTNSIMYEDLVLIPSIIVYAKKIKHVNLPLYNYLQHNLLMSNQELYSKSTKDIFTALAVLESQFVKAEKYDLYKDELEYLYIENLLYESSILFMKCDNYKEELDKIVKLIKRKFPDFRYNIYFVQREKSFRKTCKLIYKRHYKWAKNYLKL